jgi:hypothetical protein
VPGLDGCGIGQRTAEGRVGGDIAKRLIAFGGTADAAVPTRSSYD